VTKTLLNGEVRGEVLVYDRTNGKERATLSGFGPVAFSPDGKMLAAREGDNVVRVWEVGKWVPRVALKGLSDTVLCLAFSPDGKFLAAGSGTTAKSGTPGLVRLWDLENGNERATYTHSEGVYEVAFADEKTLLSTAPSAETVVKSWDVARGRALPESKGPGRLFGAVAFSPDGKTVATGIDPVGYRVDMDVKVWDRATGKELIKPLHHLELVRALAFSPDGKTLATGIRASAGARTGGEAHLWDVATGKEVAVLRGHKENVACLVFDRKGNTLATGSTDGTVKLWVLADPVDENDELWVKSEDGVLALRVSTFVKVAEPGEPVELVARLRNLSDKPVNVLRPFSPDAIVWWAIDVNGPRGKLACRYDPPSYRVAPEAFVRLKPGESVRDSVKIDPRGYPGFQLQGRYALKFTYGYNGRWDKEAEQGGLTRVWRGTIAGKDVPIEIRDTEDGTWVKSADGTLALRLTPQVKEVNAGDPIEVVASLRNLTDKPVSVLRPGGDDYRARSSGVDLQGPRGAIRYTGDSPEYSLGAASFVIIEPGETVSNHLSITVDDRQGSDRPGEYRVTFTYEADTGHRTTATRQAKLKDLWTGQIKSAAVVVKKVELKRDEKPPAANEKERVFGAFRTEVEPIVRKLPEEAAKHWLAELGHEKKWSVERQPFADALKRVENTLTPEERKTAILRGTLPDLKRDGDCWEVHYFAGSKNSLTGYLDVRTSKLVFLWLIPEG
jgi:WD40 repeat protein